MTQLPQWANWLARDEDGELWAYEYKPVKRSRYWDRHRGESVDVAESDTRYAYIKWEDEGATNIELFQHGEHLGEKLSELGLAYTPFIKDATERANAVVREYGNLPEKPDSSDMVNHPNHYKQGGLETIDIMQALLPHEQFIGYLKGNIIKYRERAEHKGNAEQDYAKAKWYYDKLMEVSN